MLTKPKFYKHSKAQKGRVSLLIQNDQKIIYGKYALISKQPSRIKASQIAAALFAMKRKLKRDGEIWVRIFPHIPITSKPAEVRMGKGKGSIDHWVARVRAGAILFELNCSNLILAKIVFELANSKLPIKTAIISKE